MGIVTYSAKLTTCDVTSAFLLLRYKYHPEAQQLDSHAAWDGPRTNSDWAIQGSYITEGS